MFSRTQANIGVGRQPDPIFTATWRHPQGNRGLYRFAPPVLKARGGIVHRLFTDCSRLFVALTALANTLGWFSYVKAGIEGNRFLELVSFRFSLTIYSLMISFSIWYFWGRHLMSLAALPVLPDGALIPISDLYLLQALLP